VEAGVESVGRVTREWRAEDVGTGDRREKRKEEGGYMTRLLVWLFN
jgi:hypothetical protein